MRGINQNIYSNVLTKVYFALTVILIAAEIWKNATLLYIFKPMLIPTLMALYYFTSAVRNRIYLISLFFALNSNIFFLSSAQRFLVYGMLAFMVYRILSIVVVLKLIRKLPLLPFAIACLPFFFIFSSLVNLTMSSLSTSFYPVILNGVLISILAGISLSSYILDDSRSNSWLAISTLLAVVLVYLFVIHKYYFSNEVFQPLSALIFSVVHYAYFRFVLEAENPNVDDAIV